MGSTQYIDAFQRGELLGHSVFPYGTITCCWEHPKVMPVLSLTVPSGGWQSGHRVRRAGRNWRTSTGSMPAPGLLTKYSRDDRPELLADLRHLRRVSDGFWRMLHRRLSQLLRQHVGTAGVFALHLHQLTRARSRRTFPRCRTKWASGRTIRSSSTPTATRCRAESSKWVTPKKGSQLRRLPLHAGRVHLQPAGSDVSGVLRRSEYHIGWRRTERSRAIRFARRFAPTAAS